MKIVVIGDSGLFGTNLVNRLRQQGREVMAVSQYGRQHYNGRTTQFFEFLGGIIKSGTDGDVIRLSPALFQPIASDGVLPDVGPQSSCRGSGSDVAAALAELAVAPPLNGMVEIAGPEKFPKDKLAQSFLAASNDKRQVTADVHARYFRTELNDQSLTPGMSRRRISP